MELERAGLDLTDEQSICKYIQRCEAVGADAVGKYYDIIEDWTTEFLMTHGSICNGPWRLKQTLISILNRLEIQYELCSFNLAYSKRFNSDLKELIVEFAEAKNYNMLIPNKLVQRLHEKIYDREYKKYARNHVKSLISLNILGIDVQLDCMAITNDDNLVIMYLLDRVIMAIATCHMLVIARSKNLDRFVECGYDKVTLAKNWFYLDISEICNIAFDEIMGPLWYLEKNVDNNKLNVDAGTLSRVDIEIGRKCWWMFTLGKCIVADDSEVLEVAEQLAELGEYIDSVENGKALVSAMIKIEELKNELGLTK